MIKYFQFKNKKIILKNGVSRRGEIYWREKASKHSAKCLVEKYIAKNKGVLITGDGDSGKTKSMMKFWDNRKLLFPKKTCIFLSAIHPLTSWVEAKELRDWVDKSGVPFKMQWQKVEALQNFCKEQSIVLFLDDVHKLSGRKLQVAKACLNNNISVCTALKENRIPPTIRQRILTKKVQRFNLSTKVAYDGTHILSFIFIVVLFAIGMVEVALLTGVFTMLSKGRLGSNNA